MEDFTPMEYNKLVAVADGSKRLTQRCFAVYQKLILELAGTFNGIWDLPLDNFLCITAKPYLH